MEMPLEIRLDMASRCSRVDPFRYAKRGTLWTPSGIPSEVLLEIPLEKPLDIHLEILLEMPSEIRCDIPIDVPDGRL